MATGQLPEGYSAITPYLIVDNPAGLIDFAIFAFGAVERLRSLRPDGSIQHAEIAIDGAPIMLSGANEEWPAMPGCLYHYVEDVDAVYARAIEGGAEKIYEPADHPYGDRGAGVRDLCGNYWWIATRIAQPAEAATSSADSASASA